jgi:hypothetical protein
MDFCRSAYLRKAGALVPGLEYRGRYSLRRALTRLLKSRRRRAVSIAPFGAVRSRRRSVRGAGSNPRPYSNRRESITFLGGAAALPVTANAQQPAMPVVGYLSGNTATSGYTAAAILPAFRQA